MPSFIFVGRNTRLTFARKPHEINDKRKRNLSTKLCQFLIKMTKMAYEKNDLKGILILVLFAMPMIASMNINCSGRAFHCVNSTHFMICVDLGGGLSTTIDDFVIPCPATTVCHENNIFECDFPEIVTPPPLQVIGVYKQSDTSEPTTVTNSVMPTSDKFSLFKGNVITRTLSIPEDVTPVVKLEVLEVIKDSAGVNIDNTTETSLKVTSSFIGSGNEIFNGKKASNKTITTSATDNNKNFEPAVEPSMYKTVNTSSDNSKSIDMVTSVIGLINLISTDLRTVASKKTSSDVLTPLDSLYDNIATTTEQYITKEVTIHGEKVNHVTDKLNIPTEIIFTESSVIPDVVSTTPVINAFDKNNTIEYMNKTGSTNQNIAEKNNFSKSISTLELVPEATTTSIQIDNILEPVTLVTGPKTTTDNTFGPLGTVDFISADSKVSDTFNSNAATTTTDQYTTKLEETLSEKPVTAEVISTNPIINKVGQNVLKAEVNNKAFTELNSTGEITTIEQVAEMNINYSIVELMTVPSLQITTEKAFIQITKEANIVNTTETVAKTEVLFNNDLSAENQSIVTQPLDIDIRTELPIIVTDILYQTNEELNLTLITTKNITVDTINTPEKDTKVLLFNVSSTETIHEKNTEPTLTSPTTTKYPTNEIFRAETSQSELPSTMAPPSVNEPKLEYVGSNAILSVHTTSATYNVTTDPVTNTTDLTSRSDIVIDPQKAENKIPGSLNMPVNLGTILFQENLNTEKTVEDVVGQTTTYWSTVERTVTTPVPSDVTENTNLSHIFKPINQDNSSATALVKTHDVLIPKSHEIPLTVSYVSKLAITTHKAIQTTPISIDSTLTFDQVSTYTSEIVDVYRASSTGKKIETSTAFPVDIIHTSNNEYVTDIPITTLPPQESTSLVSSTVKQSNTTNSQSNLVSTTLATVGYDVHNTTDLNTSNWKDSVTIDAVSSKVNPNADVNKTETVNPTESKNNDSVTSSGSNKNDESIEIVSVLDIVDSSGKVMPTGTMQQSSPKPSLSNDYIKTTASQDSGAYVTATDNVTDYTLVQVGESVSQKNSETTVPLTDTKTINSVSSTLTTLPIKEISTEKIQYVGTEAPKPSTIDFKYTDPTKTVVDYVTERNDYVSTDAMISQLNKLPIVLTKTSPSSVRSVIPGTDITPVGSIIVPVYDEVSTIKDSAFITSSTVATDSNIKTRTESPLLKSTDIDPEIVKYNKESSLLTSEVPVAQMTTEPTHTNVFSETTPLVVTSQINQDVITEINTIDSPQSVLLTNSNKYQPSLSTVGVTADQVTTEPAYTDSSLPQIMPLASTSETNQDVLPEIKTTDVSQYVTTVNNIPQPMPSLAIAEVTAPQITTKSTLTIVFAQTTPPLALASKTKEDVSSEIKTTDLSQYATSTASNNNPQFISDVTTETITDSLTAPDSMVETINVIGDKISGTHLTETVSSDVVSNNSTINNVNNSAKTVKNIIDHESIVIGTTSKTVKSVDMNKAEIVNHTEINWMGSDVNIDSVKIKESGKEEEEGNEDEEDSKPSVTKSVTDVQNKNLASDSSIIPKIVPKDGTPVDNIEYYTITTNNSGSESGALNNKTRFKPTITSESISDSHNKNNTHSNITTSLRKLSQSKSTIYDELEQHLISTNHTITTEVQSHLNESDKHSNKTSDGLPLKLNASSNDNSTTTVSASVFICTNYTRGKYADKKDCRKFYTCIGNLQPVLGTCPNNTVFSEINKQCTRNLSHCVRNNQFRCLFEGRFSDFFRDNIYYICVKKRLHGFIRYKLQCQADYSLNKDSVKCEKNDELSTQSVSTVSETNTDESKPEPKLEKIVSKEDFECEKEGKFPFATDCSKYYVCTKVTNVYRRKIKKCASDEVFDENKKTCVESDSGEC